MSAIAARRHEGCPARWAQIHTGDDVLLLDLQAAWEVRSSAAQPNSALRAAAELAAAFDPHDLPRARALCESLWSPAGWPSCPHGHASVIPVSTPPPYRIGRFMVGPPGREGRREGGREGWRESVRPLCPSIPLSVPPSPTLPITIAHGLAFGIGTHPTTRLPLVLLPETLRPGDRVLDVGCGTGILSIAAGWLGAGRIVGVDRDPQCIREARANLRCNPEAGSVEFLAARAEAQDGQFDSILANMGSPEAVLELLPAITGKAAVGGRAILSGIYGDTEAEAHQRAEEVAASAAKLGWDRECILAEHRCVAVVMRRC